MSSKSQVVASDRVIFTPLVDATGVLLDLDSKFYFTLNRAGVAVWKALVREGGCGAQVLAEELVKDFDVAPDVARDDVDSLLRDLVNEGLARIS